MPFEIIEILKFFIGIILIIIPGYLLSYFLFPKIFWYERLVFGFVITLLFFSLVLFFINFLLDLNINRSLVLTTFILAVVILFFVLFYAFWSRKLLKSSILNIKNSINGLLRNPKAWLLLSILLFSGIMYFLPHIRDGYFLPFHVDEWEHWTFTRAFIESGSTSYIDPYTGTSVSQHLEIGFHINTATLKWISNSNLSTIFVIMPFIIGILLSLTAFCIGNRSKYKYGLFAAFTLCFIPTTCRMMGPSFYIPVSFGLLVIIFTLWLLQLENKYVSILLPLIFISTFLIHPQSALAILIVIFIYSLIIFIKKSYRLSIMNVSFTLLPILILIFISTRWGNLIQEAIDLYTGRILDNAMGLDLPNILVDFNHLSIIIWILAIIGLYKSIIKNDSLLQTASFTSISFILIIGLYDKFGYGSSAMYERSFLFLFLVVSLLAGYGLSSIYSDIKKIMEKNNIIKNYKIKSKIPYIFSILIALSILIIAIPSHLEIPYYQMISESEYESYTWVDLNIDNYRNDTHVFGRAAIDPFKAPPFCAITGLYIVSTTMSPIYNYEIHGEVESFLEKCCINENFLYKYNVTVVYNYCCNNENFTKIHSNVYLFNNIIK